MTKVSESVQCFLQAQTLMVAMAVQPVCHRACGPGISADWVILLQFNAKRTWMVTKCY